MRKAMRSALLVCVAIAAMAASAGTASAWTPAGHSYFEGEVQLVSPMLGEMSCNMYGTAELESGAGNEGTLTEVGFNSCYAWSYLLVGCDSAATSTEGGTFSGDAETSAVAIEGISLTMTYHGGFDGIGCFAGGIPLHLSGSIGGSYEMEGEVGLLNIENGSLKYEDSFMQGTSLSINGTVRLEELKSGLPQELEA